MILARDRLPATAVGQAGEFIPAGRAGRLHGDPDPARRGLAGHPGRELLRERSPARRDGWLSTKPGIRSVRRRRRDGRPRALPAGPIATTPSKVIDAFSTAPSMPLPSCGSLVKSRPMFSIARLLTTCLPRLDRGREFGRDVDLPARLRRRSCARRPSPAASPAFAGEQQRPDRVLPVRCRPWDAAQADRDQVGRGPGAIRPPSAHPSCRR